MAVYVDEVVDYTLIAKVRRLRHTHWAHLTADTEDELHAFAARLGLRRAWFQRKGERDYRWHYDVTPPKREQALRLGAREIDRKGMGDLMAARRSAAGLEPAQVVLDRHIGPTVTDPAEPAAPATEQSACGNCEATLRHGASAARHVADH